MKIATFNVNSIRKRLPIVLDWLKHHEPDVLCLQETKVPDVDFPLAAVASTGYHVTFRGMKGYNGVATLSKIKPTLVRHGFHEGPDSEDFRLLYTEIDGLPILNTYIPQGYAPHTTKFTYKLEWFGRLSGFLNAHLKPDRPALWVGDLNVAPEPLDVYDAARQESDPCYHPAARAAYKKTVAWGFVDVFRQRYPDRVQYTYWDYFRNHFVRNRGWRIDHILATPVLAERCTDVEVDLEPRRQPEPSDHTVVWATFKMNAAGPESPDGP